ncbi:MAG: aminoacyl-tRNA hydrolase [Candidatus Theseobacter exili]|nr:aminoacyl-tRNA hydrolase [Candidatus Theseobacter exili]
MSDHIGMIVGLGNPGDFYAGTRHNAGQMVVDRIAENTGGKFRKKWFCQFQFSEIRFEDSNIILAKPLTYMNLSGRAVYQLIRKFRYKPQEILIVIDDVSLEFGRIRLRRRGSAGGHNGLASVLQYLNTEEVPRLRIGIDSPLRKGNLSDFVLGQFGENEYKQLEEVMKKAIKSLQYVVINGFEKAMNQFND